jgi:hypothetical protein
MRTVVLYISAEGTTLTELDAAFADKISTFLAGTTPRSVSATDNSTVRVLNYGSGEPPIYQSDREYRVLFVDDEPAPE